MGVREKGGREEGSEEGRKEGRKKKERERTSTNATSTNATYPIVFDLSEFAFVDLYDDRLPVFVQTAKRFSMGYDDAGTDFT